MVSDSRPIEGLDYSDLLSTASAAGLVAGGVVSVLVLPALALGVLGRERPA